LARSEIPNISGWIEAARVTPMSSHLMPAL